MKKVSKRLGYIAKMLYISTVRLRDMKEIIGIKLIPLKSVGSLLDPDTGCIYPQFSGTDEPDLSCEISLLDGEVAMDWYEELSPEDYELVKPYIQ